MLYEAKLRAAEIERELVSINKSLEKAPDGRITVTKKNGKFQIYYVTGEKANGTLKTVYLHKDQMEFAKKLAQKMYLAGKKKDLENELEALQKYIKTYRKDTALDRMKEKSTALFELISSAKIAKNTELENWEKMPYGSHPAAKEDRKVSTVKGFMVSSKSESIIVDELARRGFAIHYEEDLNLNGFYCNADFVFVEPATRRKIVMEHFGMMDDPTYREKTAEKIKQYINSGYTPGENLIFTFEDKNNPMTTARIRKIMDFYFGKFEG